MSSITNDQTLSQAYELIETGNPEEAEQLVQPLTIHDKDNPDVWWVYAHAVSDPEKARQALNKVLQLDHSYPGARDLLDTLETQLPQATAIPLLDVDDGDTTRAQLPPTLPDFPQLKKLSSTKDEESDLFADEDIDEFPIVATDDFGEIDLLDEEEEEDEQKGGRLGIIAAAVIVIALIAIGAILVFLNPFQPTKTTTTATPISSSQQVALATSTSLPTVDQQSVSVTPSTSTSSISTPTSEAIDFGIEAQLDEQTLETLSAALSSFNLATDKAFETRQTSLGNTLLTHICGTPGPESRSTLIEAMDALANESTSISSGVEAIGVVILDCNSNNTILSIAAPTQEAQAFGNANLSESEFQATWRPVN